MRGELCHERLGEIPRRIETRSVSFEVALFVLLRAKGPAIYLAQPEGLGVRRNCLLGPKVRPFAIDLTRSLQTVGPLALRFIVIDSTQPFWAGLGNRTGPCP